MGKAHKVGQSRSKTPRGGSGRDMLYHRLLAALGQKGCPICFLRNEAEQRYLEGLLYEQVNDPGVRRALVRSRGFCRHHAWMLSGLGDSLGVAILYKDQVEEALAQVRGAATLLDRDGRDAGWRGNRTAVQKSAAAFRRLRAPEEPCPACRAGADTQQRYLTTLVTHLDDPEVRAMVDGSEFLCMPDLLAALEGAGTGGAQQGRRLLELGEARLQHLMGELEELIRKRDYRFLREPRGEEQTSWWRAIRRMVGWPREKAPWLP